MNSSWDYLSGSSPLPPSGQLTSTWMLASLAVGGYMLSCIFSQIFGYKVPIFGVYSQLEPIMISNFRFFRHAEDVLNQGYQAVSCSRGLEGTMWLVN